MTPEQLDTLLHATNRGAGDRNYIAPTLGTDLARECDALVAAGFMTGPWQASHIYPGLGVYYVTAEGQAMAARAAMEAKQ